MIDIAVIGAGPGGLTCGIYAGRGGVSCTIFEELFPGGQINQTAAIENYPGFPAGIDGMQLGAELLQQAQRFGAELVSESVEKLEADGDVKRIYTASGVYEAKTVIIATGAQPRKLGVSGEDRLIGAGVSYCATCDGAFFRDKTVAVVGGGDTALSDAVYLAKFAKTVYVIHRREEFRANSSLVDTVGKTGNIYCCYNSVVDSVNGESAVDSVTLKNVETSAIELLPVDGVFMAVGISPRTELVAGQLEFSENRAIVTDAAMRTSTEGVYAIGDVRNTELRQVVTAVADGAIAASKAIEYISKR